MRPMAIIATLLINLFCWSHASEGNAQQLVRSIKTVMKDMGSYHETLAPGIGDTVAMILQETDSTKIANLTVPVLIQELEGLYRAHSGKVTVACNEAEGEYMGELLWILATIGDPGSIGILVKSMPTGWVVARGLVHIGRPAIDTLLALNEHNDYSVRAQAVYALGEIAQTKLLPEMEQNLEYRKLLEGKIVPALRKAERDSSALVRKKAEEALKGLAVR